MGLFSHSSNHTCPAHSLAENASKPLVSNLSFYRFNMILSGSCTAFACIVIFILMFMHATHLSKPNEQVKIMRIAGLIPLYSIFSFLSICFPDAFVYLAPWIDLFQAIALGSFFLLMCEFVSPSSEQRDIFFAALVVPGKKGAAAAEHGIPWYRKKWIMIFQYPIVATVAAVATDITQAAGVFCLWESKPYFAHLWISIAQNVSVAVAVLAIFKFHLTLKTHLAHHQPLAKLLAFKLIVFLTFLETIIFWILRDVNALNPTSTLTFADLNIGIQTMVVCVQMVPLSLFFHYAYTVRPYIIPKAATARSYQGGFLGINAWLVMWNPMETLKAIAFAFNMTSVMREDSGSGRYGNEIAYDPLKYQIGRASVEAGWR